MAQTVIPTDYCPSCRLINGLPPTTDPVGTYQSCPSCDPSTPILCCPQHRSAALADLDLPANAYYHCPACDDEWCNGPTDSPSIDSRDIGTILLALTMLTFQCGVYLVLLLGFILVLHQNYGHTLDDALAPSAFYSFLVFIFWITVLFPSLWWAADETCHRVWRGIWGQPL